MTGLEYFLPFLPLTVIPIFLLFTYLKGRGGKKQWQIFKAKMANSGFTKRIIVYDFLSDSMYKNENDTFISWWTVGMWFDPTYQIRSVAFRPDRDTWDEKVISFDKIQGADIIEDTYKPTFGGAKCKGLQVRIAEGDNYGIDYYFLKLCDPKYGTKYDVSDPYYKAMQKCAWSIVEECRNIMRYVDQH